MIPVPMVSISHVDVRMHVPVESPELTKMKNKKKATKQHIKYNYYQMSKVKAGLWIIDDLKGKVK